MASLYVHVPFCHRLCPYCGFFKQPFDADALLAWSVSVRDEAQYYLDLMGPLPLETVFFGGGTPSVIPPDMIDQLGAAIHRLAQGTIQEWTVECHPSHCTAQMLQAWQAVGMNRVSLGIQSVHANELDWLGRDHLPSDSDQCFATLRDQGIDNISADLLYALPHQTEDDVVRSVQALCEWGVTHVSTYALTIEPGTPFAKTRVQPADEDQALAHYEVIQSLLESAGFEHYEVSAFAKPGYRCRHNQSYWTDVPYLGLGPSAHSYWDGRSFSNPSRLTYWQSGSRLQVTPVQTPEAHYERLLLTGFRLKEGVSILDVYHKTGVWLDRLPAMAGLLSNGWLKTNGERVWATKKGWNVLDSVVAALA
ncbi:radical SAM family heme chaperone HemW [bacterium]|nr:radical SAM family heme chaperone HemW [bacterium]